MCYELMTMKTLKTGGNDWHRLRNDSLDDLMSLKNYSSSLKKLIKNMMSRDS